MNARKEFEHADVYKKREILGKIGSNYFLNGGKLCYDLQKPFFLFKEMKYLEKPKIEWLEPLDYAYITMKVGYSELENLIWLEERNSNIPSEIIDIFDIFADFKFVNEIREEMNRVNECMVIENACVSGTLKSD